MSVSRRKFAIASSLFGTVYVLLMILAKKQMDSFLVHQDARSAVEAMSMDSKNHSAHNLPVDDDFLEEFDLQKYKKEFDIQMAHPDLPLNQPIGVVFGDDLNRVAQRKKGKFGKKESRLLEKLSREIFEEEDKNNIVLGQEAGNKAQMVGEPLQKSTEEKVKRNANMRLQNVEEKQESFVFEVDKGKSYDDVKFPVFVLEDKPSGPGWGGRAYSFHDRPLTADEKEQKEKDFDLNYFDQWVSNAISVRRFLPDGRSIK